VVTLRDAHGNRIAENDDRDFPLSRKVGPIATTADSRLEAEAPAEGPLVVEITDRFGAGGPEYAYRLAVGPSRPDFAVTLRGPDALNLFPGATVPLRLLIAADGQPGPITLRAEGLPPGVEAEPVLIRLPRAPARGRDLVEATLVLKVDPAAGPGIGSLRIIATARNPDLTVLTRRAAATLVLAPVPPDDPRPPPTRVLSEFPVRIVAGPER
jgi:hypothetical protein